MLAEILSQASHWKIVEEASYVQGVLGKAEGSSHEDLHTQQDKGQIATVEENQQD